MCVNSSPILEPYAVAHAPAVAIKAETYNPHPQYKFEYAVSVSITNISTFLAITYKSDQKQNMAN